MRKKEEGPSFAGQVKEELVRLPLGKPCCQLSEIGAMTQTSGHLSFRGGGVITVQYRMENIGATRRLVMLLKTRMKLNPVMHYTQTKKLGGLRTWVLSLNEADSRALLTALHMMETDEEGHVSLKRMVPRHPLTRQCCRKAYLRGAFLGAGTMSSPEKGYHLEWRTGDERMAATLGRLLEKGGMPYRSYTRKGEQVVYLKSADQIAETLAAMGAGRSVLKMENIRVGKQIRIRANRAANCDEHNSERMLDAAQKQAEACRNIHLKQGLFTLPPGLQEIARLRLDNPEMSLKELGELMDPPVGKSGVNHRMRRLMEILDGEDPGN